MTTALTIPALGDFRHRYALVDEAGAPEGASLATPSIVLTHQATGAQVTLALGGALSQVESNSIDILVDRLAKSGWPRGLTTGEIVLTWPDGYEEVVATDLYDVHGPGASTGAGTTQIRRAADTTRLIRLSSGPPGPAGATFLHTQSSASADWTVNHNLGVRPAVAVLSPGGVEVVAEVVHTSINQLHVHFAAPATGSVRCK